MTDQLYLNRVSLPGRDRLAGYLKELPAVKYLEELVFHKSVTFFVGENGTGKSTLLEAIAVCCGFNPEGGSKNFHFATKPTHSGLYRSLKVTRGCRRERDGFFLRAESFSIRACPIIQRGQGHCIAVSLMGRSAISCPLASMEPAAYRGGGHLARSYNVATNLDELDEIPAAAPKLIGAYGGVSLHEQSHGESFLALVMNRFGGEGLYLLDEPEAALSPSRQMSLLVRIHDLAEQGAQFVIATHSPILMACPGSEVYLFREDGLRLTDYRDTEHFQLTKRFVNAPEKMLDLLLKD